MFLDHFHIVPKYLESVSFFLDAFIISGMLDFEILPVNFDLIHLLDFFRLLWRIVKARRRKYGDDE